MWEVSDMQEKKKGRLQRLLGGYLAVIMAFSFVFSQPFAMTAFAGEGKETGASPSDAVQNGRVSLKNSPQNDLQIAVVSEEEGYEGGDTVCLELYIQNNTEDTVTDGQLGYSAKGILEDSGYFEDLSDLYTEALKAMEEEGGIGLWKDAAETEDGDEDDAGDLASEFDADREEDFSRLTDLTIYPGQSYYVNFYYTVSDDIEDLENQKIEFSFRGKRDGKRIREKAVFQYGVGAMNLLPPSLSEDWEEEDQRKEKEGNNRNQQELVGTVLHVGNDARMTVDFDLGELETMLLEAGMESGMDSDGREASPSKGKPASSSKAALASGSDARDNENPWIKWKGDSIPLFQKKKDRPLVKDLNCQIETYGLKLNDFRVEGRETEEDEFGTSTVCSFTVDEDTKPGIYYGRLQASYKVTQAGTFRTSQDFVVVVPEEEGSRQAAEAAKLIDALPKPEEVSAVRAAYEESADEEGNHKDEDEETYQAYKQELSSQVAKANEKYTALAKEQQEEVANKEKLRGHVNVQDVTARIDELPEYMEAAAALAAYDEAGDDQAYEAYYLELKNQVTEIYGTYTALKEEWQDAVLNRKKLLVYVEMFGVQTLAESNVLNGRPHKKDDDVTTVTREESGIRFGLFNYGLDINKNGDSTYFNFRGANKYNHGENTLSINGDTDADGYGANRAKVKPVLENGYPVFDGRGIGEDKKLGYLFGENGNGILGKYTDIRNTLLQKGTDGYYTYDSAENAVDFNTEEQIFYVRDEPERGDSTANYCVGGRSYADFMPFTYLVDNPTERIHSNGTKYFYTSSSELDYWFGMTMEAEFFQPKDGKVDNQPIIFNFSGDDDVWVFIDDVLVLDLGGTHGVVTGSIDFSTGEIEQYLDWDGATTPSYPTTIKNCFEKARRTPTGGWNGNIFANYSSHKVKFFYLERGSGSSNCKMSFNLPTLPDKSLTVTKELTSSSGNTDVNEFIADSLSYRFRVVKADASGNAVNDLYVKPGTEYDVLVNGKVTKPGEKVGEDGYFTLKAGESAQFNKMLDLGGGSTSYIVEELLPKDLTGQYEKVEYAVSGNGGTIKTDDTQVTDFRAYQTSSLQADQIQAVTFRNKVDVSKLGVLKVTKEKAPGSVFDDDQRFAIQVKLGGGLLPAGTEYQVGTEKRTVKEPGILELKAGETAVIVQGILSGTQYEITEPDAGKGSFNAVYSGTVTRENGETQEVGVSGSGAAGEFPINSTVHVTVTNADYDYDIKIPISKTCIGNEGEAAFHFNVEQVEKPGENESWESAKGTPLPGTSITVQGDELRSGTIVIGYKSTDHKTCCYKISEQRGDAGFIYDETFYIVEVKAENGKAEIIHVWENGTKLLDDKSVLSFMNKKTTSLTVRKTINGENPSPSEKFQFKVEVTGADGNTVSLPEPADPQTAGYTVTNGAAIFPLTHGGAVTIPDIPVNAQVTITEISHPGYMASYTYTASNGQEVKGKGDQAIVPFGRKPITVDFTNTPGVLLPDTGGPGLLLLNRYGWMLLLIAMMLAGMEVQYYGRLKRQKREEE